MSQVSTRYAITRQRFTAPSSAGCARAAASPTSSVAAPTPRPHPPATAPYRRPRSNSSNLRPSLQRRLHRQQYQQRRRRQRRPLPPEFRRPRRRPDDATNNSSCCLPPSPPTAINASVCEYAARACVGVCVRENERVSLS